MCIKPFRLCHQLYGTSDGSDAFGLNVLEGHFAAEAVEVHTTISDCIAVGGKRMVRAAGIVACTFGRERSEEDATRIHHFLREFHVVGRLDDEVFGRIAVGYLHHLVVVAYHYRLAVLESLRGNLLSGQESKLTLHLCFHLFCRVDALADEQYLTVHAVFCLRKEVGGYEAGVACLVGKHLHFARTGRHVDGDIVQADLLLGTHHELIARTEYLIDLRHALRSVSHSADGLHPTYLVDATYASRAGCNEDGGIDTTVASGRRAEHNLLAPCYLGRRGKHEHGAEQRSRSAGDVKPYTLDGNRLLPALHAIRHLDVLTFEPLCLVETTYVRVCKVDGLLQLVADKFLGSKHFCFRDSEVGKLNLVELLFVFAHGSIAPQPYILKHSRNGGIQLRSIADRPSKQSIEFIF